MSETIHQIVVGNCRKYRDGWQEVSEKHYVLSSQQLLDLEFVKTTSKQSGEKQVTVYVKAGKKKSRMKLGKVRVDNVLDARIMCTRIGASEYPPVVWVLARHYKNGVLNLIELQVSVSS